MAASDANWTELPDDLLENIYKRLIIPDHLSFMSVCSSWTSAVARSRSLVRCGSGKFVGLVVPGESPDSETRRLLQPSLRSSACYYDNDTNVLNLAVPHSYYCCGSSYGWLILVDDYLGIQLVNPLTLSRIQLPSLATANPLEWRVEKAGKFVVNKGFLSCDPLSSASKAFVLMICYGVDMAFCQLGDNTWTSIKGFSPHRDYADAVYHEEKFYVVYNRGGVVTIDIDAHAPSDERVVVQTEFAPVPLGEYYLEARYLVESRGELFQIRRTVKPDGEAYIDSDDDSDGHCEEVKVNIVGSYDSDGDDEDYAEISSYGSHSDDDKEVEKKHEVEDNIVGSNDDCGNGNDVGDVNNGNEVEDNVTDDGDSGDANDSRDQAEDNKVNGEDNDQNANHVENNVLGGGGVDNGSKRQVEKSVSRYRTVKLKLFKLRERDGNHGWERVKSIGDRAFFLGYNGSFSVSASEVLGCRPNSVYFTDNICTLQSHRPVRHDIGVFNLDDNSVQDIYPIDSNPLNPPAFWFGPIHGERM